MKKNAIVLILMGFFSMCSFAQSSNSFCVGDLNPYLREYLKPLAKGVSTGMGGGWAHTAQPHEAWKFDLSISGIAVAIPEGERNFTHADVSSMEDDGYYFVDADGAALSADHKIPTFMSDEDANVFVQKNISANEYGSMLIKFKALNGYMDYPYAPNFSIQLSLGLPFGTEVMGRFIPEIGSTVTKHAGFEDDASVDKLNLWGLGIKHDIKQWLPLGETKLLSNLEISLLLGYSKFNSSASAVDPLLSPEDLLSNSITINYASGVEASDFNNQGMDLQMDALIGSILVGYDLPILHPFVGIGFNKSSIDAGLTGNFPVIEFESTDAVDVKIDDNNLRIEESRTSMNVQAGINIALPVLTIHAQYTYQDYSMISAGIALGMRK